MKVFTVGMDQKPPMEKTGDSPPPSYNLAQPLPMGPELPAPIIVRKSRGYKGILLVMLGVFLMAIFALTLSEMAYNRQRDENFFRLQLAQLRHRFYPHRELGERIVPVEVTGPAEALPQKQAVEATTELPVRVIQDKFPVDNSNDVQNDSTEKEELREQMARDARFQFLRRVLQKIKQNAEDMGLEGTMQVSVVEVEPQQLPEFFNQLRQQTNQGPAPAVQQPRGRFGPSEDPRSDAFLDSFGEFHAPSPFAQSSNLENAVVEPPPPPPPRSSRVFQPWREFEMPPPFFVPEMAFRPPPPSEWTLQHPEVEAFEFRAPESPKSRELANQEVMGEMYGRKFGRMLQDLIAARLQSHMMAEQQPMSLIPAQPRESFPIEQQPQQPQGWWGVEQQQQPQQPQLQAQLQSQWPQPQFLPQFQVNQPEVQPAQQVQQLFQTAEQQQQPQPQPPQPQPQQTVEIEARPPAIQPPRAESRQEPQGQIFGGSFPQPPQQFPEFIPSEEQRPEASQWPQPSEAAKEQAQQQPVIDFMPIPHGPAGWTHQSEPEVRPTPPQTAPTLVDGEVQQTPKEESSQEASPELIILRKPASAPSTSDAEPSVTHEDQTPSQLADLPLKELQGELAAAAAALAQQHEAMLEQQQREDEARRAFLQAKLPEEKPSADDAAKNDAEQQPVEPAALQTEQSTNERSEQVDFPAVKFPQADAFKPQQDSEPHIFFQVDEPQPNFGAGQA